MMLVLLQNEKAASYIKLYTLIYTNCTVMQISFQIFMYLYKNNKSD